MKVVYVNDTVLEALSPAASKVLLWFCSLPGEIKGTVGEAADTLRMGERSWRRAARSLAEAGLITLRVNTAGFSAVVMPNPKRFTWVPTYEDGRLWLLSPRACKTLLVVARACYGASNTIKLYLATIGRWMGRGKRTVQIGLCELARMGVMSVFRTGRANWFWVPQAQAVQEPCPKSAPHSGLFMRLLSLTTHSQLTTTIARWRRRVDGEHTAIVRDQILAAPALDDERRAMARLLQRAGVGRDRSMVLATKYTPGEISKSLQLARNRRARKVEDFITTALEKGWCSL